MKSPLTFEPIFMERVWGGRRLAQAFSKNLPPNVRIGESWEIVDRPEAQSIVRDGSLQGKTLHDLWTHQRQAIFGNVAKSERFPLLVKLLDAREKLSLQVHPPADVAKMLGGEPKTEFWYVAAADPEAELFVGLEQPMTRDEFRNALLSGTIADHVHKIPVQAGDAMFLQAGRFHAVGAGNLLVEIQQNSDTTYRVFDWNRPTDSGNPRQLHVDEALQSIDFNDAAPSLVEPKGELLVQDNLFEIQKWDLNAPREIAPYGRFAIVFCITGGVRCGNVDLAPGEFFLVPASLEDRQVKPIKEQTSLLRVAL
jgi:mannose-6-phosphate isomerase